MNKKKLVKAGIEELTGKMNLNSLETYFSGVSNGARWHETRLKVSRGTIQRALNELVEEGILRRYMQYGHCYDEWIYEPTPLRD